MKTNRLFLLGAALLTVVGCGGGASTIPIKGKLVFDDGKPVSGASIRFMPTGEKGRMASGYTSKDGTFELTTVNAGDGAQPGDYVVVVSKVSASAAAPTTSTTDPAELARMMKEWATKGKPKEVDPVPVIYGSEKSSPLKWKIESGNTEITLKINR